MMETEDEDDQSRSLIPDDQEDDYEVNNNNEQQYSATMGHEIELIVQYVRHNRPSRLPELEECLLAKTKSFSNDTHSLCFRLTIVTSLARAPAMTSQMENGPKGQMSKSTTSTPSNCPVPDCHWMVPPNTHKPHAARKQHLITEHNETHPSDYMTPTYCHQHGFHLCRSCDTPTAIFNTQGHLRQHITKNIVGPKRTYN